MYRACMGTHELPRLYQASSLSSRQIHNSWRLGCREMLEQSSACLCPSVAYQLAGAKKVQQDLAQGSVLQSFTQSQADAELLQACFAGVAVSVMLLCSFMGPSPPI